MDKNTTETLVVSKYIYIFIIVEKIIQFFKFVFIYDRIDTKGRM